MSVTAIASSDNIPDVHQNPHLHHYSRRIIGPYNFGFDHVKGFFLNLLSVPDIRFICAEGLDIVDNSLEQILQDAIKALPIQ